MQIAVRAQVESFVVIMQVVYNRNDAERPSIRPHGTPPSPARQLPCITLCMLVVHLKRVDIRAEASQPDLLHFPSIDQMRVGIVPCCWDSDIGGVIRICQQGECTCLSERHSLSASHRLEASSVVTIRQRRKLEPTHILPLELAETSHST